MSASAATMSVGTCRPRTSSLKSKSLPSTRPPCPAAPEVFGTRRDPVVELVHRRVLHEGNRRCVHLGLLSEHLGGIAPDVSRGADELAHLSGYFTAVKNATPPPSE